MEHSTAIRGREAISPALEIRRILRKNDVFLSESQVAALTEYVQLLLDWNKRLNLISRKDVDSVWESHILHSLTLVIGNRIPRDSTILDLGTGGGLPGIPIAVARPDLTLTLLDATKKKTDAVSDMTNRLALRNVKVVWGRAEDVAVQREYSARFDLVVSRAAAPLADLVRWSKPLLVTNRGGEAPGGKILALKGGNLDEEALKTKRLSPMNRVTVDPVAFEGSEILSGVDKKIVTVWFDATHREEPRERHKRPV